MSHPTLPPELDPRGPRPKIRRSRQVPLDAPADRPVGCRPTGRRRWPVYVAGALACLVVVFSVVGSAVSSWYFGKINRVGIAGLGGSGDIGQPQNWLLVGSDNRAGLTREEIAALHVGGATTANAAGRRSDTMILLHLSAGTGKATLISLPRDSYVQIPAYKDDRGRQHPASHNKLNASYDLGGPQLTVQTVELATGLHIDHYVEIGFGGFVKMVDTLGGVSVCSTTALHDPKSGLAIDAGTTTLNGKQALAYVRARYVDPTADLGRMKRQQAFLGSLFRKALSTGVLLNPLKLNSFLSATLSSVTVDDTVTRDDLLNLAAQTGGLSPSHVVFATVPLSNVNYRPSPALGSTVLWDQTRAKALWAALEADQPIGSQTAKSATPTAGATSVQVAPSRIVVQVSNGGGVTGAGAKATDDLTKLGLRDGRSGDELDRARRHADADHVRPALRREPEDAAGGVPGRGGQGRQGPGQDVPGRGGHGVPGTQGGRGGHVDRDADDPRRRHDHLGRADRLQDHLTRAAGAGPRPGSAEVLRRLPRPPDLVPRRQPVPAPDLGLPVAAAVLVRLGQDRRDRPRLEVLVDRHVREVGRRDGERLLARAVPALGDGPDADLHRRAAGPVDLRHDGEQVTHPHRDDEDHLVQRRGDRSATGVPGGGDAGDGVDQLHHDAAMDGAEQVGVRRGHDLRQRGPGRRGGPTRRLAHAENLAPPRTRRRLPVQGVG